MSKILSKAQVTEVTKELVGHYITMMDGIIKNATPTSSVSEDKLDVLLLQFSEKIWQGIVACYLHQYKLKQMEEYETLRDLTRYDFIREELSGDIAEKLESMDITELRDLIQIGVFKCMYDEDSKHYIGDD